MHLAMSLCPRMLLTLVLLVGTLVVGGSNGVPVNPASPTSSVAGNAFDRYVVIWLENTVHLPS